MENEIDQVISLISRLGMDCSAADYLEFLKDLKSEITVMINAAENY